MCETWKVTDDWDTTLNAQIHWLNITNSWLSRLLYYLGFCAQQPL